MNLIQQLRYYSILEELFLKYIKQMNSIQQLRYYSILEELFLKYIKIDELNTAVKVLFYTRGTLLEVYQDR